MGATLEERLRSAPLSLREARVIFAALRPLHDTGVAHGAISSRTIRLGETIALEEPSPDAPTTYRGGEARAPTIADDVRAIARMAVEVLAHDHGAPLGLDEWRLRVERGDFANARAALLSLDALLADALATSLDVASSRGPAKDPVVTAPLATAAHDGPGVVQHILVALASSIPTRVHRIPLFELGLFLVAGAATAIWFDEQQSTRKPRPLTAMSAPSVAIRIEKPKREDSCRLYHGDYALAARGHDYECVRELLMPWLNASHLSGVEARALATACEGLGDRECASEASRFARS